MKIAVGASGQYRKDVRGTGAGTGTFRHHLVLRKADGDPTHRHSGNVLMLMRGRTIVGQDAIFAVEIGKVRRSHIEPMGRDRSSTFSRHLVKTAGCRAQFARWGTVETDAVLALTAEPGAGACLCRSPAEMNRGQRTALYRAATTFMSDKPARVRPERPRQLVKVARRARADVVAYAPRPSKNTGTSRAQS
jgi:hypothetical protein